MQPALHHSRNSPIADLSPFDAITSLAARIHEDVIGQTRMVSRLIMALLANGNVLIEGLPGLAKTRAIKSLSKALDSDFSRIQFTPDLLPSDVTGGEIYRGDGGAGGFEFRPGPIFGNLILADEINRAPAKVQSALLEAMEERQVTIGGKRHKLPDLFMVLATQNPIEQEGTYPLPEAQMDRFLMHIKVDYPSSAEERQVLRLVRGENSGALKTLAAPVAQSFIFAARAEIAGIKISEIIENYIVALVQATRTPKFYSENLAWWIALGASPRGTLALDQCARTNAWLQQRDYVTPEDVQEVAPECLRHRLSLSYDAIADGITADDVITELLKQVAVAL
jgi:MoxR-like ATPase